jgi:diguanylate cyclase (GGDEF)-like protein
LKNGMLLTFQVTAAAIFLAYSSVLLWDGYRSQGLLKVAVESRVVADSVRRARALGDFVGERRNDVDQVADAHEIMTYLANKSLSMSFRYGLAANLTEISDLFTRTMAKRVAGPDPLFTRFALIDESGAALVDTAQDGMPLAQGQPLPRSRTVEVLGGGEVVVSAPVTYQGGYAGAVVAWATPGHLLRHLISSAPEANYREFLIVGNGERVLGYEIPPKVAKEIADLPDNRVITARTGLPSGPRPVAMVKTPVAGTPWALVTVQPQDAVYGQITSKIFLVTASCFPPLTLLAAAIFERMRRRNARLHEIFLKADLKRSELQVVNTQLSDEIVKRKEVEKTLREKSDEINRLVFYDYLTGLPNRQLLLDRLRHALVAGARTKRQGALLFIDMDNFKSINDTLGHARGDLLLQQVGQRLTGCVRECDTVARFGGDEFVVLLEDLSDSIQDAAAGTTIVGEKILAALNHPYVLNANVRHSTPSIGATLFGDPQVSTDELLKQADLAMYQAKANGRNTMRFFDPEMQSSVRSRSSLEADLRSGLQNKEFFLCYQPQVDGDSRLTGGEVLVRWRHPARGVVSPGEFIPLAEETGLILPLGQWVLNAACLQLAVWAERADASALSLSVNVSARQFRQPDFVAQVLAVLDRTGINPHRLKLELTESLLLSDAEDVISKMNVLKRRGLTFSLDDFGTGYSSLTYLKKLPLDQLKIDQSFVRSVLTDANDAAIVSTIIALASTLGLAVIAEGVETQGQRDFLAARGCHCCQGYLFSQPLPIHEFDALLSGGVAVPSGYTNGPSH